MSLKLPTCLLVILIVASVTTALERNLYYEKAIYTDEYGLSIFPDYPPELGQTVTLRLRTFDPAQKITLITDRYQKIPMTYRQGHWWAKYEIPGDYQTGGHFFTVWIKRLKFEPKGFRPIWTKSLVWYKTAKPRLSFPQAGKAMPLPSDVNIDQEEPLPVITTGEAANLADSATEEPGLTIKGRQNISFKSRTLTGSKEGYTPGTQQSREDTLRVSITGRAAETDIEASLYRTSAIGVSQVSERDEEISIRLKRASTEVFLGDLTTEFTETEFSSLVKELSGAKVKGDYGKWGFKALYATPKGQSKEFRSYGDGTQGPYNLDFSPVVIDSERVLVDGRQQLRGEDYNIDYQAGTITFINSVIDQRSILIVHYDHRQSVYSHSTYGLRVYDRLGDRATLGISYLSDADSLTDASSIRNSMSQEVVSPQSHYVLGADGSYDSESLSVKTEVAYSVKNLDLLSASATKETGRAGKLEFSSYLGPLGLTGHIKRIGPRFSRIADPLPKQDVWAYGYGLNYRPGSLFGAKAGSDYDKYTQDNVTYENEYQNIKLMLTPLLLPSMEYHFSELDESNDPVTGSQIRRAITKNSIQAVHQFSFWSASAKATTEKWLRQSPSEEVTDYKRINFGLATLGLDNLSFSSNIELEDRVEPDLTRPVKRTYDLRVSATPSRKYFASASLQLIDDSVEGQTNVTDLSYKFEPAKVFKATGKYTIKSLLDDFPATVEAVSKQSGTLSFDLRPNKRLRLRYSYKPNFTTILRTQTLSYNNEQGQVEVNLLPTQYTLLGLLLKQTDSFSLYNQDYPNYTVRDRSERTKSTLGTIKIAPYQFLSTELNHWQENSYNSTLTTTAEPYIYLPGQSVQRKIDLIVKTQPTDLFSVDSRYTFTKTDQGSNGALANIVDSKSHTAMIKGQWNYSRAWTWSLTTAYTRTTDYLLSRVIYTFSPGFGFIYRLADRLRIDFDFTHSQSYGGENTQLNQYELKAKYLVSDYVDMILRLQQEHSIAPDYRLTDITGNVEIKL